MTVLVDVLTVVAVLVLVSLAGAALRRPGRRSREQAEIDLQQKDSLGWDANRGSGGMFNGGSGGV